MTTPALAFNVRGRGRHYPWKPQTIDRLPVNQWGSVNPTDIPADITPFPSVTNVTSMLSKGDGLLYWSAEQSLRGLYDSGALPLDVEQAVARFKGAFRDRRQERADEGTRAHTLAEKLTLDLPLPSDLEKQDEAYADAYMAFWSDHKVEPVEVEATVYNYAYGYAGTADLFAVIDGVPSVVDYKTRGDVPDEKKLARYGLLFDENRLQLAALAACEYVAVPHAVESGSYWSYENAPEAAQAVGVVLLPDGTYRTETLDREALDRWYDGFLGCLRTWHALKGAAA
jgi:hypothetical protein